MRKEIYEKVSAALLSIERSGESVIKHVDLWNHNVEFIEQEEAWARPAVFVEFGSIGWTAVKDGEFRGRGQMRLHVVTDWGRDDESHGRTLGNSNGGVGAWDLCDAIERMIGELRGETFHELRLVESQTNHNHEEILETVEVYEVRGSRGCREEQGVLAPASNAADNTANAVGSE